MSVIDNRWRDYEELARHILTHFAQSVGISAVEAKQRIDGKSGTEWEVDAKAITADGRGFLIVECKERTSARIPQATIASLAYTIQDTGAAGGIVVTSIGLQEGASLVAKHEGIHVVYLPRESSFSDYLASCANLVVRKLRPEQAYVSVSLMGAYLRKVGDEEKPA